MRNKIICSVLVFMLLFTPSAVFAGFDDYGYNQGARIFNDTLDNWENRFVEPNPASPVDPNAKDVWYLVRKWNKDFDSIFKGEALVDGAWQQAHLYMYLSGDMEGWTVNRFFKMVYSSASSTLPEGALPVPVEAIGMTGFYFIQDKTWLTDPQGNEVYIIPDNMWITDPEGNEIQINEFHAIPPSLGKGLYKE